MADPSFLTSANGCPNLCKSLIGFFTGSARLVGKAQTPEDAALIGEEVEALYTNGPAAGGGVRKIVNEVVGIVSTLMARSGIEVQVTIIES